MLQHLLPGAPTRALQPCPAPAVFEDGVVCTIGSGGPLYGTGEAAETPQEMVVLCPPGMMCKLDCPWLSPYLFVCLGGWPVGAAGSRQHTRILLGTGWESSGVDCFPYYKIAPDTCPDLEFIPGFACRPSDLVTRFGIISACRGFSVSFVQPLSMPSLSVPGEIINDCFSFDMSCSCVIDV